MNLLLAILFASASAQQFNVQTPITVVCPGQPATASGSNVYTCPGGVVPPICPSPPGAGPCPPPEGTVYLGNLTLDGSQTNTSGVTNKTKLIYGSIFVPLGQDGKTFSVAALTNGSSNPWFQVTLTKTIGDFSNTNPPTFSQGATATIHAIIGTTNPAAVSVQPGTTVYFNIRLQLPFGGPSCTMPVCDFGVRAYPVS